MSRLLCTLLFALLSVQFCLAQRLATRINENGYTVVITGPNGFDGTGTLPSSMALAMSTSVSTTSRMTQSRLDSSTVSSTPSANAVDSWGGDVNAARTGSASASGSTSVASSTASATTKQTNASAAMSHAESSAPLPTPFNFGPVAIITLTSAISLWASVV
ncbi:hypothetical protein I305_00854 [Cryptococcus gattii E566]|uniref:Uncharacterized protein n=2 Tax=Cryptococcus gattii TaxID=37769 RepID=E6R1L8_CRYGW|nr:uncharacterized protein CGB_C5680W [Cryptococcus gattii WM276]ADV21087.1 hypothetical protein CNC03810 [Cryptococcus gattii WM276]KIR82064.1 hypothetical protein I306_00935 [Cryptococcus gattii EJB2]KIY36805.1 hypothetical protein I305_00854 [Cryptococcus gattii E566]KJE04075.1 hypothetical protein I311_02206 [Cryptococcus gattii NT-10]